MQQSSATQSGSLLHALTPPRSAFLYLQFLERCHPYILLLIFILVSLFFYPGLALTVAHGEMPYVECALHV